MLKINVSNSKHSDCFLFTLHQLDLQRIHAGNKQTIYAQQKHQHIKWAFVHGLVTTSSASPQTHETHTVNVHLPNNTLLHVQLIPPSKCADVCTQHNAIYTLLIRYFLNSPLPALESTTILLLCSSKSMEPRTITLRQHMSWTLHSRLIFLQITFDIRRSNLIN